jgi:hypothetical protein
MRRLRDDRSILGSLPVRLASAAIYLGLGWFCLARTSQHNDLILLPCGMACLLAAATLLARPIAQLIAAPAGNLFYPEARFDRPQPMYSIPESKRKQGLCHEAMAGFRKIADEYPGDVRAYVEMIDIAVVDLHDGEFAETILQRGLAECRKEEDREILRRMYTAIVSRLRREH